MQETRKSTGETNGTGHVESRAATDRVEFVLAGAYRSDA